jgi:hypothetical protein
MSFGIEVGADFNGGETVTFQAIPFFAERPEFAEGKTPTCPSRSTASAAN